MYRRIVRPYHFLVALCAALIYGFPSRNLIVIAVTGTKGKSSTAELIHAMLTEAGYKTALASTIHFKIAGEVKPNRYKMTMPGRFFIQRFLRDAVTEKCSYAIIEMTSEGVLQYRHKWIALDMLVFTNISPEHIESHGSFENYLAAKLKLRDLLEESPKKKKWMVVNGDDEYSSHFLAIEGVTKLSFSLKDAIPYNTSKRGVLLTVNGESIYSPLMGVFNIYNILAAIAVAESQHIQITTIKQALEKCSSIEGRAERIEAGQPFTVIVDYAHTADSLQKLYSAFEESHKEGRRICVLGGTGGGRDSWKRKHMGTIADTYCSSIILTDEDPYDEDPDKIITDIREGIKKHKPKIIMDRRDAIREALAKAHKNDVVLITGKGTDPFIMGPRGKKTPWSDKAIVLEEIHALLTEKSTARKV